MLAVEHANLILSWQENLAEDEMPPEWMWSLDEELNVWFEGIEEQRKSKYGGSGESESDSSPMMSNELAQGRR